MRMEVNSHSDQRPVAHVIKVEVILIIIKVIIKVILTNY